MTEAGEERRPAKGAPRRLGPCVVEGDQEEEERRDTRMLVAEADHVCGKEAPKQHGQRHGPGGRGSTDRALEVVRRLSGRRTCAKNGHVYHVEFDPPKREGVCDQDGSRLVQRDDDTEEAIERRLNLYEEETSPLLHWYKERSLLIEINGTGSPDAVTRRVVRRAS